MANDETKQQLDQVNSQLQNLNASRLTCDRLIESGSLKIVDANDKGEAPLTLSISGDIVADVLAPVIKTINVRKENMLAIKERLLGLVETPPADVPAPADTTA
jgi:hypothetical protein